MHTSWLRTQHRNLRRTLSSRARSWMISRIPKVRPTRTDVCMLCEKRLRRHRNLAGAGRICSPACAELWAESL
jgi:hypothetical protein